MREFVKKILLLSVIVLVFVILIGLLLKNKEIYIGFTLGGAIAVLNFYMIAADAEVIIRSGERAKRTAVLKFLIRYIWIFAIITVAVLIFHFNNFFGLFAGMFLVRGVIFVQKVILKK